MLPIATRGRQFGGGARRPSITSGPTFTNNGDGTGSIAVTLDTTCYAGIDFGTSSGVYTQSAFDYTTSPTLELVKAHTIPIPDAGAGGTVSNGTYYARIWVSAPSTGYTGYVGVEFSFVVTSSIGLVQQWTNADAGAGGTSVALAFTSVPTAGSILIAGGFNNGAAKTLNLPTDDSGDGVSWTLGKNSSAGGAVDCNMSTYYKVMGTPSGGGKTVTITGTNGGIVLFIAEFNGNAASSNVDGTPTANSGSGSPSAPGTVTTTRTNGLVVGMTSTSSGTPTAVAPFTRRSVNTTYQPIAIEDYYPSAAGPYDANMTNGGVGWNAIGIAFK
jgi:hypothetical protein